MLLRLFVGITDRDWYELLRRLPVREEVNFWTPGGNPFGTLEAHGPASLAARWNSAALTWHNENRYLG